MDRGLGRLFGILVVIAALLEAQYSVDSGFEKLGSGVDAIPGDYARFDAFRDIADGLVEG